MMGGVFGAIVLMGIGQVALQLAAYRQKTSRPREPWELG